MWNQAGIQNTQRKQYYDFPKLRELHRARLAAAAKSSGNSSYSRFISTTNSPMLTLSSPFSMSNSLALQSRASSPYHLSTRSFLGGNPISDAFRDLSLKRLEVQANQNPQDAALQYTFLTELAEHHPQALISRITHPAFREFAINREIAVLYLQTLMKTGQVSQFNLDELIDRVQKAAASSDLMAGMTPEVLNEWKHQIKEKKLSKQDQANHLMQLFLTGSTAGIGAVATAGAGALGAPGMFAGAAATPLGQRGIDPRHPLHVQIAPAGGAARSVVISFVARAALLLVAFSAVGALLDERGIGRGMGMNSGSKHVQEAEQDGRKVKFEDVKGVEEAKAELEEIVMYLKDPSKFTRLGGKLPRGLLLTGPPGTGKTLLAKAIAGEAGVPFFYSSGSQFEEVYVGLGAKRIRELFEAAKKKAPAIIFIDEIDAVGGTRKLKDQSALKMTLNELLVQLDGFDENNGIIVIGATNFVESLDQALLRPGRFDKHVSVPLPDVGGRKEILEMYAKKTKLSKDVDLTVIARGTTGFSGADLYNLMNQAALKASIDGLNAITMSVLEYAKDKILMGAERKSAVITAETAKCTAYHEAGHALIAVLTAGAMPIHKATIMPRGSALGMVTMLPEGDQTSQSKKEMLAFMDVAMGGRVAEELTFGKDNATSGAMSDIQNATRIARNMVTKYGFSDEIGIVFHGGNSGEESASPETRARIDQEVKKLTDESYRRAKDLLSKYSREHKLLAETLLEYETLTGEEVQTIIQKRTKPKRPIINKDGGARGGGLSTINGEKGRTKSRIFGKDSVASHVEQ